MAIGMQLNQKNKMWETIVYLEIQWPQDLNGY